MPARSCDFYMFEERLGVFNVMSLKLAIEQRLDARRSLECDLSQVGFIDLSFVQLAVSAHRSFVAAGLTFRILRAPSVVMDGFARAALPKALVAAIVEKV